MKVYQALDILNKLDKQDGVYCLIYIREDAEIETEDKPVLTDTEWENVVTGMEVNDDIDAEAYRWFKHLINTQLQKRKSIEDECVICGDTATHFEATTTKAACCNCCGDCPDNCKGRK